MAFDTSIFYGPSAKDLATGNAVVRRWYKAMNIPAAAAAVISLTDPEVGPVDTVRLIHGVTFSWVPGAAQTPIYGNLAVAPPGGNSLFSISFMPTFAPGAALQASQSMVGVDMYWMQGEQLSVAMAFNAGAANNSGIAVCWGYEFPRGTFQR